MFVDDVRCATTGAGSSWKLSGGSPLSSGPTTVSKNRHVRRAVARSSRRPDADNGATPSVASGWLTQRATAGDRIQSTTNGAAKRQCPGAATATTRAAPAAPDPPPPPRGASRGRAFRPGPALAAPPPPPRDFPRAGGGGGKRPARARGDHPPPGGGRGEGVGGNGRAPAGAPP